MWIKIKTTHYLEDIFPPNINVCFSIRRTGWNSVSYSPYHCILQEVGVKYGSSNPRKFMDKVPSRFLTGSLRNSVKLLMH